MITTIVAVTLLALCVVVSCVLVYLALRRRADADPRVDSVLRYASVAAITTVGSSAMHLFALSTAPSTVTLVFGDVAMMCGPGMLWIALRAMTGRARPALIAVAAAAVVLGVVVATVPYSLAIDVRSLVLAVLCALALRETWRDGVRGHAGIRIVRIVMTVFSAYMLAAAITGVVADGLPVYAALFSFAPMTIVGIGAIASVTTATVLLLRELQGRGSHAQGAAPSGMREVVSIPDFAYMPVAYGHAQADVLERALIDACRSVDPAAERLRPGAVVFVASGDASVARARVRERFSARVAAEHEFVEPLAFAPAR